MRRENIEGIQAWRAWLHLASGEGAALDDDLKPSSYDATRSIAVAPYSSVMLQCWGQGSENDGAFIQVAGWMSPNKDGGVGVGFSLWKGTLVLGPNTISESPCDFPPEVIPKASWREVKTYSAANDPLSARLYSAGATRHMLEVPTLGFTHLTLEMDIANYPVNDMRNLAAIWRPVSTEWQMATT